MHQEGSYQIETASRLYIHKEIYFKRLAYVMEGINKSEMMMVGTSILPLRPFNWLDEACPGY